VITAAALLLAAVLALTVTALCPDARALACHTIARLRGGQWFIDRQECPGCGRQAHILRHVPALTGTWTPADTGIRCIPCASGNPPSRAPRKPSGGSQCPAVPRVRAGVTQGRTGGLRPSRNHSSNEGNGS
jgi:hypothetical protein